MNDFPNSSGDQGGTSILMEERGPPGGEMLGNLRGNSLAQGDEWWLKHPGHP